MFIGIGNNPCNMCFDNICGQRIAFLGANCEIKLAICALQTAGNELRFGLLHLKKYFLVSRLKS
jgi:hypothetical protein